MNTEKEKVIYEFEVDFKKSFIWRSNLSNDDIISYRPGLKTLPSVENEIFWSEIGSGFGEPGGILPPRIPRSTPRREIRPKAEELSHVPNLMQISTRAID